MVCPNKINVGENGGSLGYCSEIIEVGYRVTVRHSDPVESAEIPTWLPVPWRFGTICSGEYQLLEDGQVST